MRRVGPAVVLVPVLALTGACTGDREAGAPAAARSSPPAATFVNPVYVDNFPDPGVLEVDGTWYAYGTNDATTNVPLLTSTDLVHWTKGGDALPEIGSWAMRGDTWAPEVARRRPPDRDTVTS